MNRKNFLKKLGIGVIVTPFVSPLLDICSVNNKKTTSFNEDCGITKSDMLGPYYVSGTSQLTNLNTRNLSGDKIIVTGIIYGGSGINTPIANAMIEVWHADDKGVYHPIGNGNVSNYQPSRITLRGYVITDANGKYAFESIRPGFYSGRPRHFHYKITANGYRNLITQIYFKDDSKTARERIESCRIVDFQRDNRGVYRGKANIHLQPN